MDSMPKVIRMDELGTEAFQETVNGFVWAMRAEIRAELAATEVSKKDLAEASGVSYPALNRYLAGQRQMPVDVLLSIIFALDLDMHPFWRRVEARAEFYPSDGGGQ